MENIKIENFLSLKKIDINLKKINILIGPQAQGKSVIAKLIKYFKDYPLEIVKHLTEGMTKRDILKEQKTKFIKIFPEKYWEKSNFSIRYSNKHYSIEIIHGDQKKFKILMSEQLATAINKARAALRKESSDLIVSHSEIRKNKRQSLENCRETIISSLFSNSDDAKLENVLYIPAGRSFFANLQKNVFSFLSSNIEIDHFLTEFGSIYEQTKNFISSKIFEGKLPQEVQKLVDELICGKYSSDKGEDWITASHGKINVTNSSSGQQESLPMALMLSTWPYIKLNSISRSFIIEEPEAHLFPSAQAVVVSLIANAYNKADSYCSYTITTHSPYILSALNNLIQAGNTKKIIKKKAISELENLYKITPKNQIIDFNDVTAYMISNGKANDILENSLQILDSNEIDNISNIFSDKFNDLIELEFKFSEN